MKKRKGDVRLHAITYFTQCHATRIYNRQQQRWTAVLENSESQRNERRPQNNLSGGFRLLLVFLRLMFLFCFFLFSRYWETAVGEEEKGVLFCVERSTKLHNVPRETCPGYSPAAS